MWSSSPFSMDSKDKRRHSSSRPLEIKVRNLDDERGPLFNSRLGSDASAPMSMDSLLRLFRSDFFDAFMAVTYLYRYRDSRGVQDYLCNELYVLSDADLEAFMPQLCNLLVHHTRDSPALERFIMDKCSESMHFALQVFWFLQAAVEDAVRESKHIVEKRCRHLRTRCETAAVNGSQHALRAAVASHPFTDKPASRQNSVPVVNNEDKSLSSPQKSVADRNLPSADLPVGEKSGMSNSLESSSDTSTAGARPSESDIQRVPLKSRPADETTCLEASAVPTSTASNISDGDHETFTDFVSASSKGGPEDSLKHVPHSTTASFADKLVADNEAEGSSPLQSEPQESLVSDKLRSSENSLSIPHECPIENTGNMQKSRQRPDIFATLDAEMDPMVLLTMKQERFNYFNDSVTIAKSLVKLSLALRKLPTPDRQDALIAGLEEINEMLLRRMSGDSAIPLVVGTPAPSAEAVIALGLRAALRSIHLPLTRANSQALRILRVHPQESVILTSRTRAPFLLYVEVLPTAMFCSDRMLFCEPISGPYSPDPRQEMQSLDYDHRRQKLDVPWSPGKVEKYLNTADALGKDANGRSLSRKCAGGKSNRDSISQRKLSELTPAERQVANVRKVIYGDGLTSQPDLFGLVDSEKVTSNGSTVDEKSRQAALLAVYGELWSWKEERLLKSSPFSSLNHTKLMPFIVKAGDDLRQEQLAIQLISQFDAIFRQENVDVFLRPFTVMSVSSEAGLVEVIPDAVSVHTLKKRTPNFVSLLDYFERAYGSNGSSSFRAAQRRFIRSMAGYSLITYFLQIKDRHNGNIMLDARGHVVHIDFGFMLTNSPGSIKFENVPFKLTEEYLQVICGQKNVQDYTETAKTEGFRYFQELFVLGLLAARKHSDKITTLVEIMLEGTSMPCMTGGHSIVDSLKTRFALGMPEQQCISYAIALIEESRLSWRSAGYDRFQEISNGYR